MKPPYVPVRFACGARARVCWRPWVAGSHKGETANWPQRRGAVLSRLAYGNSTLSSWLIRRLVDGWLMVSIFVLGKKGSVFLFCLWKLMFDYVFWFFHCDLCFFVLLILWNLVRSWFLDRCVWRCLKMVDIFQLFVQRDGQVLSLSAAHALMALLADAGRCLALSVRMAMPCEDDASPWENSPPLPRERLTTVDLLPDLTERTLAVHES